MTTESCDCERCACEQAYNEGFKDGYEMSNRVKRFYSNNGIIQPIRAIHRQYDAETFLSDVVEEGMDLVDPKFDIDSTEYSSDEKSKYISSFLNKSTIIGYFGASICKNSLGTPIGINISFSVCRPEDYDYYTKACSRRNLFVNKTEVCFLKHCFETKESARKTVVLLLSFKDKRCMMSENGSTYFFPITIQQQFEHFLDRCVRYFKVNKKEKIVQKKKGNKRK